MLQAELARCAFDLTGADARANDLLLDLGCGSGLSAKVAVAKKDRFVVGGDVASDMLGKIDRKSMGRVDLVQFDFAQRWPFRDVGSTAVSSNACQEKKSSGSCERGQEGCGRKQKSRKLFDAAISISAVQWLYMSNRPESDRENIKRTVRKNDEHSSTAQAKMLGGEGEEPYWKHLFSEMAACVGGNYSLQFYPLSGNPKSLGSVVATAPPGHSLQMLYPHNKGAARKFFLTKSASAATPVSSTDIVPKVTAKTWCALCWPYLDASCCLHACTDFDATNLSAHEQKSLKVHIEFANSLVRMVRRMRKLLFEGASVVDAQTHFFENTSGRMGPLKILVGCKLFEVLYCVGDAMIVSSSAKRGGEDATRRANPDEKLDPPKQVIARNIAEVIRVLHSCPCSSFAEVPETLARCDG